ncbi:hypothetical protein CRE_25925 [Caenorhabditis remanei]|uniref:Uncharacterized protein n=1 Tax=Caenorhabditis remanei TaxID=31234 RepID=E3NJA7_CAERE|nr:hypothetical protein CRE_25925 [Caenorhabditis remanei]
MIHHRTPKTSYATAPYRLPLNRRLINSPGRNDATSRFNQSGGDDLSINDNSSFRQIGDRRYSEANVTSPSPRVPSKRIQATVDGRWSAFGFAATELYDYENGIPLDRATCDKNLQKLIKNSRDVDYYEFLRSAQECRLAGNRLLENVCLQMAFSAGMVHFSFENISWMVNLQTNVQSKKAEKVVKKPTNLTEKAEKAFSLDGANESHDRVLQLPNKNYFRLSAVFHVNDVGEWSGSNLRKSLRAFARYIFDKIAAADPEMPCYASSKNAEIYVPVSEDFLNGIADYAIAGFGLEPSGDNKAEFFATIKDVLACKLNRVRKEYNLQHGKGSSERYAEWLKDQLSTERNDLLKRELVFDQFAEIPETENIPQTSSHLHDSSGDFEEEEHIAVD